MLGNNPKYLNADKECVLRIQKGEFDALRVLCERYYDDIRRYVTIKVFEIEDAKDITNQVFSTVIEKITDLNDPAQFRNWLFTIVNQHIALYFRKRKASKIIYTDDLEPDPPDDYQKLDNKIHGKIHNMEMLNAKSVMRRLNHRERQVLLKRYNDDLSYDVIAGQLGKSEVSVRKMVERARNKFRKLYLQRYKSPVYSGGEKNEENR